MIGLCHRMRWRVYPRADRWSNRAVAQFGGASILLAWTGSTLCFAPKNSLVKTMLLLALATGAVGLVDDIWGLLPRKKFAAQCAIACAAVIGGVVYPLGPFPAINVVFTIFWIVGLTNAFNLLDNMDGLSGGVAVISLASIVLLMRGDAVIVSLAVTLIGALLGFLVFNVSPAKIFMGDTGSLAIGFLLACLSATGAHRLHTGASMLAVPVLLLFLPIFDTLLVSFTRVRNGRAISAGARDHSSHRLVQLGLSERQAVFTLYAVAATASLAACLWTFAWSSFSGWVMVLFALGAVSLWVYLAQVRLPENWLSQSMISEPAESSRVAAFPLPVRMEIENEQEQR